MHLVLFIIYSNKRTINIYILYIVNNVNDFCNFSQVEE